MKTILGILLIACSLSAQIGGGSSGNARRFNGKPLVSTAPTNNQIYVYNSTTGRWELGTNTAGSGVPGGSSGAIQYNNGGAFAGLLNSGGTRQFVLSVSSTPSLGVLLAADIPLLTATQFPAFTGDVTKGSGSLATTVTSVNGVSFASLATGLYKNTTSTGVPSIAIAGTDYTSPTGTETLTNKTLTTPTIASFVNATHNHSSSAGGGTLGVAAHSATGTPGATTFLRGDNTWAVPAGSGAFVDPGANGVVVRTALNTSSVVTGTSTNCVHVDGTSATCGSGGAAAVADLTDLQCTLTSSTVLTCTIGNIPLLGVSYSIAAGTITLSGSSTGVARIAVDTSVSPPIGKVYLSSGTGSCTWGTCSAITAGSSFVAGDYQLYTWTYTSGSLDPLGGTNLRGLGSLDITEAGTGLQSTVATNRQVISVNTSLLPIFTLAPGTGANLASGSTITPTNRTHHVTGTAAIATITATAMIDGEVLTIVPDGAFTTTTGGNIALASTGVVNRAMRLVWDSTAAKWYPAY